MAPTLELLLADLADRCRELGKDGGLVGPSVYDTAQVLRFAPPENPAPALQWLEAQQHDDGGWGDTRMPLGRTAPTLAAVLALHQADVAQHAQDRALAFLKDNAARWAPPLPEDIPIGAELIIPHLLEEADAQGLHLDAAPYAALQAMGEKRRAKIAAFNPPAGTTPLHSWEAWATAASPDLIDGSGGIGHSPSATAAWLRQARLDQVDATACARVEAYLRQAEAATGTNIPGVMPTVYPIVRFERLWVPYAFILTGLLDQPELANVLQALVQDTADALTRAHGLGFSDHFAPDGDDTAAGVAVLLAAGRPVDVACMEPFRESAHFSTWPYEMNPSLSTTTRAIHALSLAGQDVAAHRDFLVSRQHADGQWAEDKWHLSWLYTTSHAIAAMADADAPEHQAAVARAVDAVLTAQDENGGWGSTDRTPDATSTAYAVLALYASGASHFPTPAVQQALDRAYAWLREDYVSGDLAGPSFWIGKEVYRPQRVDHAMELVALTALAVRAQAATAAPGAQTA